MLPPAPAVGVMTCATWKPAAALPAHVVPLKVAVFVTHSLGPPMYVAVKVKVIALPAVSAPVQVIALPLRTVRTFA